MVKEKRQNDLLSNNRGRYSDNFDNQHTRDRILIFCGLNCSNCEIRDILLRYNRVLSDYWWITVTNHNYVVCPQDISLICGCNKWE
jgi:hypothetical protein